MNKKARLQGKSFEHFFEDGFSTSVEEYIVSQIDIIKRKQYRSQHANGSDLDCQSSSAVFKEKVVFDLSAPVYCLGDDILEKMNEIVTLRTEFDKHQSTFVQSFVQANYENIYGKDYEANEVRLKKENNIEDINRNVLVCCPRRWGKTFATAWFIACCLVSLKNKNITVFSPSQRQSRLFTEAVIAHLEFLASQGVEHEEVKGKNNKEVTGVRTARNDQNIVRAVPSKEETARGVPANIIVMEEAASMSKNFFCKVVVPLMIVEGTSLIAISTIRSVQNFFYKLLNMTTADGRSPLCDKFSYFPSCRKCRKAGKGSSCPHMLNSYPSWFSSTGRSTVTSIYLQLGEAECMEQEMGGMSHGTNRPAFDAAKIKQMFSDIPLFKLNLLLNKPRAIFFSIDPTGGGRSDIAMASGVMDRSHLIILGLESITCTLSRECMPQLVLHLRMLLNLEKMTFTKLVGWVEKNGIALCVTIVEWLVMEFPGIIIPDKLGHDTSMVALSGNGVNKRGVGVPTLHKIKQNMHYHLNEFIEDGKISFYENLITVHPPSGDTKMFSAAHQTKNMLMQQLLQYSIQETIPTNPAMQIAKVAYSGKTFGNNSKDDLVMALQILLYWTLTLGMNPSLLDTRAEGVY